MVRLAASTQAETVERLLDIVAREGLVDRSRLDLAAPLDGLGIKSADVVVILLAIEEEFGVYVPVDDQLSDVKTVGELVNAIAEHVMKAANREAAAP
jgi:acyl carrier protein